MTPEEACAAADRMRALCDKARAAQRAGRHEEVLRLLQQILAIARTLPKRLDA